jgi:hypothetical protein
MIPRFLLAALCVLGPLTCVAHGVNINGEATYVSFSVPGAIGTYPMSINNSMTVTGYYTTSYTTAAGFIRDADGAITTLSFSGSLWTEPVSINAAGDITGFYEVVSGIPQGFTRYADGRTITFDPPEGQAGPQALPVSINNFDEVAGNYPYPGGSSAGFTRSRAGDFAIIDYSGAGYATAITGLNSNGAVVGYCSGCRSYRNCDFTGGRQRSLFGARPITSGKPWSVDRRALDPFNGVYRQDFLLSIQLETKFAQDRENCGQACEIDVRVAVWWRWGQPHGQPTFRVYGEQSAKIGAIYDRQIGPVFHVMGKVVHTYRVRVQGVAEADDEVMAAFWRGIEDAVFRGDRRLLELWPAAGDGKSIG